MRQDRPHLINLKNFSNPKGIVTHENSSGRYIVDRVAADDESLYANFLFFFKSQTLPAARSTMYRSQIRAECIPLYAEEHLPIC